MTKSTKAPAQDKTAARRLAEAFSADTLDSLIADAVKSGTPIDGADGLLNELTKAVLERALNSELTHHLGYEAGDPAGRGSGNSRNGTTPKTVATVNGPVRIEAPRDRNGSFEPAIVPKKTRRLNNINSVVLSLYSRGMTTRDIEAHLAEVYGASVSRELISNITEVVVDEIKAWQSRPLDEVYPILYIDGLRLRIGDNGVITTKVAYLAIGVDLDGRKHALGCWIQDSEGAKFWQKVVIDLRNRGVRDILIACCDGLTGLPDAIRSIYPDTVVQTCVVHVVRNAMRFVSYKDRKKVATAMRTIYTAPTVDGAELALKEFDQQFGTQYPGAIDVAGRLARIRAVPGLSGGATQDRLHH
ncbi:IS256 family transposase [Mycolicibacter algericus]|uniref:Mutator family transposase n=1 Tax=Mycolicibacter algericus TaxID=1288388 RepID=A0A7I9YHH6_MYCAL|nr:IS256 family transposase [Mycolicibacter algericus]